MDSIEEDSIEEVRIGNDLMFMRPGKAYELWFVDGFDGVDKSWRLTITDHIPTRNSVLVVYRHGDNTCAWFAWKTRSPEELRRLLGDVVRGALACRFPLSHFSAWNPAAYSLTQPEKQVPAGPKCPSCNQAPAYQGFLSGWHCLTPSCNNFDAKWYEDADTAIPA